MLSSRSRDQLAAMRRLFVLLAIVLIASAAPSDDPKRIGLNGRWYFAIDPVRAGEEMRWHEPGGKQGYWAEVNVPHCWPVDPRYPYVGAAWYRRSFTVPADTAGKRVRLVFRAVFYRAKVWVNGELAGRHEGGFTPFEFDITPYVKLGGDNTLAVEVDNSWNRETLPGARPGPEPYRQVYHFWDHGGIVRDVYLLISSPVYIANQRVIATPDLSKRTASVDVTVWAVNTADRETSVRIGLEIERDGSRKLIEDWQRNSSLTTAAAIPAGSTTPIRFHAMLRPADVELWDQDHPHLYRMRARLWNGAGEDGRPPDDSHETVFGIRQIEVAGVQLLLNGEPIRMGGGHRVSDHPVFGLIEPDQVVHPDMAAMKTANMELARMVQHPLPENLLDWADRHGFLIIEEAGNWQLTAAQMDSPVICSKFQSQMREMMERDWNHPSVFGWSLGNEYESNTPSGVRWTRDMYAFVKNLDPSRLITFISLWNFSEKLKRPEDEGSQYVDIVSPHLYGSIELCERKLDLVHSRWPGKPIFVSEFGERTDRVKSETEREEYFRRLISLVRSRYQFVIGAAVWTYNDYRSRWPDTNPDGIRHWGMVSREREPRGSYEVLRQEFSPVLITDLKNETTTRGLSTTVRVQARPDFPAYTLRDYEIRYSLLDSRSQPVHQESRKLRTLRPGEEAEVRFGPAPAGSAARQVKTEVVRPTGFVAAERTSAVRGPN